MSVNENESTSKGASQGIGVDMISNPISGTSFPEAVTFQQITVQGISTFSASASVSQMTVSGLFRTASSGIVFIQNVSGAATGGSGGSFSGKDPTGYIQVVAGGALAKIPYFS